MRDGYIRFQTVGGEAIRLTRARGICVRVVFSILYPPCRGWSRFSRPQAAAAYEGADLIRQAATLLYGLIKNHPWVGGIKRTATTVTQIFLRVNHRKLVAPTTEQIEMVSAVESDRWGVEEIEAWLRPRPRVVTR